jgi:hypothetical protein
MPKLMNELVVSSTSESTLSTGAVGGGGGTTYEVSVLATEHGTTNGYSNLSWSNVSTVQHGTFENGTATSATPRNAANATNVSRFTFDTAGIYVVEFITYGQNPVNGFQFIDLVRNGSTERDEVLAYVGTYASYNRKPSVVIRQFNPGDELTFFSNGPTNSSKLSRILIAKIG